MGVSASPLESPSSPASAAALPGGVPAGRSSAVTADKTNQTNLLWVPYGRGRGWASEPPVVQQQASALARAGESVAPGVWTAQAEIGRHQPAVDRTGIAAAAARAQVGAARAQLRAVLGQHLGDRPAPLASPLPAHPRLASEGPVSGRTR